MCPKCNNQSHGVRRKIDTVTEDIGIEDFSCSLDFQSSFQLSTVCTMSETSQHNLVYKRRNIRENSAAILSEQVPDATRRSGDCFSVISSDAPLVATKDQNLGPQVEHKIHATQALVLNPLLCNNKPHISNSGFVSGSSAGEPFFDEVPKSSVQRLLEVDSVNDSCSSSKSNMEHVLSSTKTEVDETGECSSSSATFKEDIRGDLSEKDFCISILRSHGLIGGVWETRDCASAEAIETSNGEVCCRSCKICGRSEATTNLLICDLCEESFHMTCCNPRIKKIPTDEWFCHSCLKKRYKILKATEKGKASRVASVSGAKNVPSKGESNAIMSMLRDTEPYTTGVRIGKGFQAEVPDWSGPINSDLDYLGEPLEVDPMESIYLHDQNSERPFKLSSIGNWLQCREVLDGTGDGANGTMCGKWRRAPLFETQTDKWECFCSVLWDPSHADCAVPQELETEHILKQLKYIELGSICVIPVSEAGHKCRRLI